MLGYTERTSVTLFHDLGRLWQLFANRDAVRIAAHRLVRRADALGCIRLHVEHVDVRRPAPLEKEDHRLRPGLDLLRLLFRRLQQLRKRESEQPRAAELQRESAAERSRVETGTSV